MRWNPYSVLMSASLVTALAACNPSTSQPGASAAAPAGPAAAPASSPPASGLARQIARFAPTDISADLSGLAANERQALVHMLRAAQVMDAIFLEQVWAGNEPLMFTLLGDGSEGGRERLHYFLINKGPWSRLDHNEPFVPAVPAKPAAANFYPPGATKEEVEQWIQSLSPADRGRATGFFTTIRRGPDGRLTAVPYSTAYQGELEIAATHLREAAKLTSEPTLKAFLDARAAAFLSNDYYDSDVKWMELEAA